MTFDKQFLSMMPNEITVEFYSGLSTDGRGTNSFSTTSRTVAARIEQKRRLVRNVQGREVVSEATIYTPPFDASHVPVTINIRPVDRITLPSGFLITGSSQPPIITVDRLQDDTGDYGFAVAV